MADELCLCRFIAIFILFLPHFFALTFINEKNWKNYCISVQDHSVCTIESFLQLAQRVCRNTDLLEFRDWTFTDKSLLFQVFPVDKETRNYVRQVQGVVFSTVRPVPLKHKPYLVAISSEVITDILDLKTTSVLESPTFVEFVAGNKILPNAVLLSHRYGGHQFGDWAGQLGDGRAVMLGEYTNRRGDRWELQLKGSGKTPYSRHGDGRAVLRSSVREFLASEAMFHLGIPTSRAASLVVSNDRVWRDQFYDGHPMQEKAAVVLRLAKSWFRIGSLEILAHDGEDSLLRKVVDFVIEQYFQDLAKNAKKYLPELRALNPDDTSSSCVEFLANTLNTVTIPNHMLLAFFSRVVLMTSELISKWQSVGFTHGVCNTDNFSLLSITIDYGPFGFMDDYDPDFIPNTSDEEGRYSYKNQPNVGFFNLEKLLQALRPLLENYSEGEKILFNYADLFNERLFNVFRNKLGLLNKQKDDEMLIDSLLWIMSVTRADFTMSFRELSEIALHDIVAHRSPNGSWALKKLQTHENWGDWVARYADRIQLNGDSDTDQARKQRMQEVNPRYVLRNWMAQSAIQKAERNDFSEVRQLLEILKLPFTKQEVAEKLGYSSQSPPWASQLRVSCSS